MCQQAVLFFVFVSSSARGKKQKHIRKNEHTLIEFTIYEAPTCENNSCPMSLAESSNNLTSKKGTRLIGGSCHSVQPQGIHILFITLRNPVNSVIGYTVYLSFDGRKIEYTYAGRALFLVLK